MATGRLFRTTGYGDRRIVWNASRRRRAAAIIQDEIDAALDLFENWFLASGTWDDAGVWLNSAQWTAAWFLSSGVWDLFGAWDDAESW